MTDEIEGPAIGRYLSDERAERLNTGKPKLHYALCFPEALKAVARVSTQVVEIGKYDDYNFLKGSSVTESIDSLMRHLLAFWCGEDGDPESGFNHLDHVVWNAMRLCDEYHRERSEDDRPKGLLETLQSVKAVRESIEDSGDTGPLPAIKAARAETRERALEQIRKKAADMAGARAPSNPA